MNIPACLHYQGKQVKRLSEGRIEKLCPSCNSWMPQSDKHFTFLVTRGHYHNTCKACLALAQAKRRAQLRETA